MAGREPLHGHTAAGPLAGAPQGQDIPRVGYVDATLPLLLDPYGFISKKAQALGTNAFLSRILLQDTLCLVGAEAARSFYNEDLFAREGAAPRRIKKTLLGEGGVQGLDGEAHRQRKAMFLDILDHEKSESLVAATAAELAQAAKQWRGRKIVLYDEMRHLLTRAVCDWAGVPLDDPPRRTQQLSALYQHAGAAGPPHWAARRARQHSEAWLGGLISEVRSGHRQAPPESALAAVAHHRDAGGDVMPLHVGAVELLNVLRPTVAVSVFITLLAHALHAYPHPTSEAEQRAFVQEVRRYYPFFPTAVARLRQDTHWNGFHLKAGTRALLDLHGTNHDPAFWDAPQEFRPERFPDKDPGPYRFAPQGAGDRARGHRCAGEPNTVRLMEEACRFLLDLDYDVPDQDLRIQDRRTPALPRSGFAMQVH